jgi:hypothetical protein
MAPGPSQAGGPGTTVEQTGWPGRAGQRQSKAATTSISTRMPDSSEPTVVRTG